MGVGNHLYLWLWADIRVARGEVAMVLNRPSMDQWLPHFPTIRPLVIDRADIELNRPGSVKNGRAEDR